MRPCESTIASCVTNNAELPRMGVQQPELSADVNHRSRRLHEFRLTDVVTRFFLLNCTEDILAQFLVTCAGAHASIEVVLHLGKEAGTDFSVRREPDAAAGSAEGLCDRSNYADLARAVLERI